MIFLSWAYRAAKPESYDITKPIVFYVTQPYYLLNLDGLFNRIIVLKVTRRYGPLRRPTSSSGRGLWPRLFLPFGQKRAYYAVLAHFWHNFGVQ